MRIVVRDMGREKLRLVPATRSDPRRLSAFFNQQDYTCFQQKPPPFLPGCVRILGHVAPGALGG